MATPRKQRQGPFSSSKRASPNLTDNNPDDLSRAPSTWDGDQLHRKQWFNKRVREAKDNYQFIQLIRHSTVPNSRGQTAVYNDSHACDHAAERNLGT